MSTPPSRRIPVAACTMREIHHQNAHAQELGEEMRVYGASCKLNDAPDARLDERSHIRMQVYKIVLASFREIVTLQHTCVGHSLLVSQVERSHLVVSCRIWSKLSAMAGRSYFACLSLICCSGDLPFRFCVRAFVHCRIRLVRLHAHVRQLREEPRFLTRRHVPRHARLDVRTRSRWPRGPYTRLTCARSELW